MWSIHWSQSWGSQGNQTKVCWSQCDLIQFYIAESDSRIICNTCTTNPLYVFLLFILNNSIRRLFFLKIINFYSLSSKNSRFAVHWWHNTKLLVILKSKSWLSAISCQQACYCPVQIEALFIFKNRLFEILLELCKIINSINRARLALKSAKQFQQSIAQIAYKETEKHLPSIHV